MEAEPKEDDKPCTHSEMAEQSTGKGDNLKKAASMSLAETNQHVSDPSGNFVGLDSPNNSLHDGLSLKGPGLDEHEVVPNSQMVRDSGKMTAPISQDWEQQKRRSIRRKSLVEILKINCSELMVSSGKRSKRLPRQESRTEEQQKTGAHQLIGESSLGIKVHDSQIINVNRILGAQEPQSPSQNLSLSPRQICGFLTQLGVTRASSDEEVIRVIAEMEQRDQKRYTDELQS
ncbi:hypothetical protein Ancab_016509 [Ancistrocladus abbreviatus]